MTRLQTLIQRRERLIDANSQNHYTQSGNVRIEKYYDCLLAIKKEINTIECVNVRPAKALVGMSIKQLFELNKN